MKIIFLALALIFTGPFVSAEAMSGGVGLEAGARSLLAKRFILDLGSADARRSIRGTRELWTDLSLQKFSTVVAMDSLQADLKLTDMEGQLRSAGFKLMDPNKRSLAMGLRPTLILSVLYAPKGTEGNQVDEYLVTAAATQDVTPLGGDKLSMTTWLKAGDPIASSGNSSRSSATRSAARCLPIR